ncbi:MAG: tryptophan synthase subunit alpha [Deltaproteobacteria bacterium]|nr:tryptophan synthase subunit alpha [Deltaproteobacteria bacterium]
MAAASTRIAQAFAKATAEGRKALVIYLTAGDPNIETSFELILAAADAGMDVLELGIPWSDPSADGLAIQGAMQRALEAGGGMSAALKLCRRLREARPALPIVLFGYANPIVVKGCAAFAKAAREAGADAVLCVDWPADEDRELPNALAAEGLAFVPLLAPTSTPDRVRAALDVAGGFVYYVSLTGITGAKLTDFSGPAAHVAQIRAAAENRLPVVVGFGIATAADVKTVAAFADGVVVGSAAVRVIETTPKDGVSKALSTMIGGLAAGLK